jgi:murein DD-endopeptidase MepM/ murein hydrolase activator NlpD
MLHGDGRPVGLSRTVRVRAGTFGVRRLRVPPRLLAPELVALERRKIAAATAHPLPAPQWDGPFRLPVDAPVTSHYGVRSVYNGVPAGYHLGVDFSTDEGTPVAAAQRGLVTLAEPLPLGGRTVVIDHGAGVFTTYLHLAAIAVRAGQPVRSGDLIGRVGSTGLSTGPHLHWGLRVHGVLVDPLEWATGALARR